MKQAIGGLQKKLMTAGGDVSWVKMPALHLTLRFLGAVAAEKVASISEALDGLTAGRNPFFVTVEGVGAFPDIRRPRVIWIGLRDGEPLVHFQRAVEASIETLGFEPEARPFQPHLTIGRVRSSRNDRALIRELETEASWSAGVFGLSEFCLMRSELRAGGAVHTPLWSKTLSG